MKGGFDLYGNYYLNVNDAINAETSQCNEIENRNNRGRLNELQKDKQDLKQRIQQLEERVAALESNPTRTGQKLKDDE